MALYLYSASKTFLHLPIDNSFYQLILEKYAFKNCLRLLYLEYLSKINLILVNNIFNTKIVLFLQSSSYQLMLVKITHIFYKTITF
jgi:hypothetical protein